MNPSVTELRAQIKRAKPHCRVSVECAKLISLVTQIAETTRTIPSWARRTEGHIGLYWYQDKSDKCRYKLSKPFSFDRNEIDLNALDPRLITFEHYQGTLGGAVRDTVITRYDQRNFACEVLRT